MGKLDEYRLTPTDKATLEALANGITAKELAITEVVQEQSIQRRIDKIVKKLGVKNRTQAVYVYIRTNTKLSNNYRQPLPDTRESKTHTVVITDDAGREYTVYITYGVYPDGRIGELFVSVGKQGSTLRGYLDAWSRMVSVGLQWGVPITEISGKFKDVSFEPLGATDNTDIPTCKSIIDYVAQWLESEAE